MTLSRPSSTTIVLLLAALCLAACDGPASGPTTGDSAAGTSTAAGEGGAATAGDDPGSVDEATFEAARNAAFRLDEARSLPGDAAADIGDVLAALQAVHVMRPQAFGVNRRLGQVYADLRMNKPAVDHYRLALQARPQDNSVRQSLVALLAMIEADEEMLAELPILRADPEHRGEALFLEARLRDMRGDRATALELLAQADELLPVEAYRALSLHGRFLFQEGDFHAAEALFARAQQGRPDYKEAIKGLADCARRLGRPEEAEHWSAILSLLLDLTDDEYVKRRPRLRREKLTELLQLLPEYTTGYKRLADLHRRNGDVDAACAVIEQFIAHHGQLLEPADIAGLRERYCTPRPKTSGR